MAMEFLKDVFEDLTEKVPEPVAGVVIGKDGLKHCAVCGEPLETIVTIFGKTRKLACVCSCFTKQEEERQRQEAEMARASRIARLRDTGFSGDDFRNCTFETDDGSKPKPTQVAKNYVAHFAELSKAGKGLLFYGSIGTGKTFLAACIANALIDKGVPVMMTNFSRIVNRMNERFDGKQEYLDRLNEYGLLVIDDLAAERQTEYMTENVYNVIDSRYRAGSPMIITTNLTIEELKNPTSKGMARIYDRVLERCFPVEVAGASHRREKIKQDYQTMKGMLGL